MPATINLDPTNPTKGKYTLQYSATVNREVEITDADDLQTKVATATDDLLRGNTRETRDEVSIKKKAGEDIIVRNDATQEQIDDALQQLTDAIENLRADKRPLEAAATNRYNQEPVHIQNNPIVDATLAEANRVYNLPKPNFGIFSWSSSRTISTASYS